MLASVTLSKGRWEIVGCRVLQFRFRCILYSLESLLQNANVVSCALNILSENLLNHVIKSILSLSWKGPLSLLEYQWIKVKNSRHGNSRKIEIWFMLVRSLLSFQFQAKNPFVLSPWISVNMLIKVNNRRYAKSRKLEEWGFVTYALSCQFSGLKLLRQEDLWPEAGKLGPRESDL